MSITRGMDKENVVHIYNGILISLLKGRNNAITAKWMELEIIILNEVRQRRTNIRYFLYVQSKKKVQMNLFTKQKQTHRCRKQINGCAGGRRG